MIDLFPFAGYTVAVLGLGKSGIATAKALQSSEANVWAWDDNEDVRQRAREEGVPLVNLYTCNWDEVVTLVMSPGIPHTYPEPHDVAKIAKAKGIEIIGDIELLARAQREAGYIGITGTNGKSTTTTLIGHIMQVSGREVEIGGNLGQPVLEMYPLGSEGAYVLEMSSYQLETTLSITFDVAVLLNISEDHLGRHGGMEGYIKAKKNIFRRQTKPRTAVIGIDDEHCRKIYEELAAAGDQNIIPISGEQAVKGGVYCIDGVLVDDTEGTARVVLDLAVNPALKGSHNGQNAAAAYAACKAAGVNPAAITASIQSFAGLVHRQELVRLVDNVLYVNDSKATNADAASKALDAYDNIYWIAGGQAKEGGIASLDAYFGKIKKAFLIGEAANDFAETLSGKVECEISETLDKAVTAAAVAAKASDEASPVVLLAPACASWDQFKSFEARGDAFRDLVEALDGIEGDPFERDPVEEVH